MVKSRPQHLLYRSGSCYKKLCGVVHFYFPESGTLIIPLGSIRGRVLSLGYWDFLYRLSRPVNSRDKVTFTKI